MNHRKLPILQDVHIADISEQLLQEEHELQFKSKRKRIEEVYLVLESDYTPHGSCFPVIIKDTGVIGAITVSELGQEEDYKLVVQTIRDYLAKEK